MTQPIHLSFCQDITHSSLRPLAPRIAKDLGPFLLITSEDTLSLVLEALSVVVEIEGDWITPQLAGDLVTAVLDVWRKNVKGIALELPVLGDKAHLSPSLRPYFYFYNRHDPRNYRSLSLSRRVRGTGQGRASYFVPSAWVVRIRFFVDNEFRT